MTFLDNTIIREDLEEIYKRNIKWDKLKGKTILITGAYGMLASYVTYMCIYLNEVHHYNLHIIAAVRSKEKLEARFGEYIYRDYFEMCFADISRPLPVQGGDVHYIIHGASYASSQYYGTMPIDVILPNILGTIELLNLASERKNESFLLFSSGEVYGKIQENESIITEESMGSVNPMDIRNCYCESKRMAEMLCNAWFRQRKISAKIARICHTYGPTMDIEKDQRVFSSFVNDIVNCRNIVMKSNGLAKRPFCYIADAVAGYFLILLEGKPGEAYNVCNEDAFVSIKQLADTLVSLYPDRRLKVDMQSREKGSAYMENTSAGDIPFSSDKLKALGWKCRYSMQEGFKRTIRSIEEGMRVK